MTQNKANVRLEVIIVNWNGRDFIGHCLKGLRAQTFRDFEITIVDNGSSDGSLEYLCDFFPEVNIIALDHNTGFCRANNIALKRVQTEYVALLNNDAVARPQWLQKMVATLDEFPQAGFAASKMVYYDEPGVIDRAGDAYTTAGAGLLRGRGELSSNFNQPELIFGASAGAGIYRMRMLKRIGYFDEDFFLLYEDVDLSFRAQLKGYVCRYVPDAVVHHMASRSIGYDSPLSVYYGHRNIEWVYFQNMPGRLLWMNLWRHLLYDFAALFYFSVRGMAPVYLKAKIDAFKNLKSVLQKRKRRQRTKTVNNRYIKNVLTKENSFKRFTRRLKRD